MSFQFYDPKNIEFGICRGPLVEVQYATVPVDNGVRTILEQMVHTTRTSLGLADPERAIGKYELSEQYASEMPLTLPLDDPLVQKIRTLYSAGSIPINTKSLNDVKDVTAYFSVIYDQNDNKLLALRRAAQFKAMLKRRLIRVFDDTLQALVDTVFQLDTDFDLLVADETVYILRPGAFEQLADIDTEILEQAGKNTAGLDAAVPGIRFSAIAPYVSQHKRAARIVAALLRRGDLAQISVKNLRRSCQVNGIAIDLNEDQLVPRKGQELAFLNLLDRRRYVVSLIAGKREQYEAGSRKGVGVHEHTTREPPLPPSQQTSKTVQRLREQQGRSRKEFQKTR